MARPRKPPRIDRREETGIWEVIYFCPNAGRTVHRSLGTPDEAKARQKFADWLVRFSPEDVDQETVTVGDVLSFYMDYVERECLAKGNVRSAVKQLRCHLGSISARTLSAVDTNEYTKKRRAKIKDASIRSELSKLRAAYSHAAKNAFGGINFIPTFGLPAMSEPKEDYLTPDQMQRVMDYLIERRGDGPIPDIEVLINLAFRTAARKTAICELTWERVDLTLRRIDYRTPEWRALPRKHRSKRRSIVPISDKLMAFLLELKEQRKPEPTDRLVRLNHAAVYRQLDKVIDGVGFVVQPHLLRRTFGSIASMSGTSTKEISRIMGNTEKIAEERYIRFNPNYLKDAVEID